MSIIKYSPTDWEQINKNSIMHRSRLYDLLRENDRCRIVGVIADSGFGKSVLIQGYLQHEGKTTLWCTFNGSDSVDSLLDKMNDILTHDDSIEAIVFDNCSIVANEVDFVNAIPELLSLVPGTTVFLLGTALPELPFAVMRAKEQYFELNYDDLSLNRQETEMYFNDFLGYALCNHEIDIIFDKTHGWFISLQLINTYLRKNHLNTLESLDLNFMSDITDINDYFSYNLFENQSAEMQHFLLGISPVTELDAEVIDELLDTDCAEQYLNELKEYHGFAYITPSSKKLKLHPLFRQYLYERYVSHAASKCLAAHEKLIGIYENKRNYIMAFSHAVACNNYDSAIRLMKKISDRYNPIQLLGFIDGHLEEISPELLFSNTSLFLQRCMSEELMAEMVKPLTDAINHEYDSLRLANLQHRLGVIYYHLGNLQMAKDLLEKSLTNSERLHNTEVMAFNYQLLADCHMTMGDTAQALRCTRNALYLSEQNNITILQLHTLETFARIQLTLDHVELASDYIWQAIELAAPNSYELFWLYAALSTIEIAEGLVDEPIQHATKATEIIKDSICGYDIAYTHYILAKALINAGKAEDARLNLDKAYKHSEYNGLLRLDIIKTMLNIESDSAVKDTLTEEYWDVIHRYNYDEFLSESSIEEETASLSKTQTISIITFDNFSISYNSIPVTIKRTSSLRLLQLLIVNRGRFISKEYIIEQLFPDSSASAGTNNFNVALSVLRKTMDAAAGITDSNNSSIIRERNRYKLNPDIVTVDASTFEKRYMKLKDSQSSDLRAWLELSALFNGAFMADYPYESFISIERERLAEFQKDVILNIARAYAQDGNINRAFTYYGDAIALDEYDEDTYYEALEMLFDNHAIVKAHALAEKMKRKLEDEMGIPCSEQVQSMFDYYHKREDK